MVKRGISLYSYQQAYYMGQLDLEGCVAAAAATGVTGIELIPEQMPTGRFPDPTEADVTRWKDLMAKYKVEPTCMDSFIDFKLYASRRRNLTIKEQVHQMERDLKLASRLGFYCIRVLNKIHMDVIEAALPIAEHYGVVMGREIHPPVMIDSPYMEEYVNMLERTGTKFAALIPDFGIFARRTCDPALEQMIRAGQDREYVYFAAREVEKGSSVAKIVEGLEALHAKKGGPKPWVSTENYSSTSFMRALTSMYNDPELLIPYLKHVIHFHGKCYELDEECNETTIDYPGVVEVLKKHNWDGYISTEYEGQRLFHDEACPTLADEIEQVARHQKLLKRLIEA